MKKKRTLLLCTFLVFVIIGIITVLAYRSSETYRRRKAETVAKWDCSVTCAEKSNNEEYVITYSDVKVMCKTGIMTVQNRNDFEIVVHLLCQGEDEIVSEEIPSGGSFSFHNIKDNEYTVGVHANVEEGAEIQLAVFDGTSTELYV